jgi:hypothetical protein
LAVIGDVDDPLLAVGDLLTGLGCLFLQTSAGLSLADYGVDRRPGRLSFSLTTTSFSVGDFDCLF